MDLTRVKYLAGNLAEGVNMYSEPKANHTVKAGGEVVKKDNEMEMSHKKGGKGNTAEPKANHEIKLGGKKVAVKEMAQAIVDSGDVEGTMRSLLEALQEAGVEL